MIKNVLHVFDSFNSIFELKFYIIIIKFILNLTFYLIF